MGTLELTDLNGNGPYIYKVDHLHMHGPSEHKMDGEQFDLEFHIVHVLIGGPGDWEKYKDKLGVVGFLFKVAEKSHPFVEKINPITFDPIETINFAELLDCMDYEYDYKKYGKSEDQVALDAQKNLKGAEFYHYKGSLTNPPCADVVNWNVYKKVLPISQEHLDSLREIWFENLNGYGNFRHCQPLYGRRIVSNFKKGCC
jgi:carbonic anhydrase